MYLFFFFFPVVTGATDGIGKAYAEEVRIPVIWKRISVLGKMRHCLSSAEQPMYLLTSARIPVEKGVSCLASLQGLAKSLFLFVSFL